jgi:hypothetical protein
LALRRELTELNGITAKLAEGEKPPEGSKAAETVVIGMLLITLAGSPVVAAMVKALGDWLSWSRQRSIRLECGDAVLETTGVSKVDQERLITEWLERCRQMRTLDVRQS